MPVVCFPDMEYDEHLRERCAAKRIGVIFGVEDLVRQLQDLAEAAEIYQTPNARTIKEEVERVRDGAVPETPAGIPGIQVHVDLVEVHIHVSAWKKRGWRAPSLAVALGSHGPGGRVVGGISRLLAWADDRQREEAAALVPVERPPGVDH